MVRSLDQGEALALPASPLCLNKQRAERFGFPAVTQKLRARGLAKCSSFRWIPSHSAVESLFPSLHTFVLKTNVYRAPITYEMKSTLLGQDEEGRESGRDAELWERRCSERRDGTERASPAAWGGAGPGPTGSVTGDVMRPRTSPVGQRGGGGGGGGGEEKLCILLLF